MRAENLSSQKFLFTNGESETILKAELMNNALFFDVQINNSQESLRFLVDSGSAANYLDKTVSEKLGLKATGTRTVQGAGQGRIEVEIVDNVSFKIPGLVSMNHKIHVTSLPRHHWNNVLDGLFGTDFTERFVITLDYSNEKVTVTDPSKFHYDGPGAALPLEFPSEYGGKLPFVHGTIQVSGRTPEESAFLLDSGSQDMVDHPSIAGSLGASSTTAGIGLGNPSSGFYGRVEKLQLGPFVIPHLYGAAGPKGLGSRLIGGGVLKNFKVILDYARNRVILETAMSNELP